MRPTSNVMATLAALVLTCGPTSAADHLCAQPPTGTPQGAAPVRAVESLAAIGAPGPEGVRGTPLSILTSDALAAALKAVRDSTRPMQEVNTDDAKNQATKTLGSAPPFTSAEAERQRQSTGCNAAYDALLKAFSENTAAMSYPVPGLAGLATFARWYYDPDRSPAQIDAAQPVYQAELAFAKACLANPIPTEMNPDQVRRAVGIFSFESQPFCSGLRETQASALTAKHCFVNPDGTLTPVTALAQAGKGKLWFQFEAEPDERYEVCLSSLPKTTGATFVTVQDNIRVTIAKTQAPPPSWRWSSVPIADGTSLYLRGHFPFGNESEPLLSRMRATAFGGCAAFDVHDRCVFHGCQAMPSMSGAPIFYRPDSGTANELLVVGLHLGTASLSRSTEPGGNVCLDSEGSGLKLLNFAYQPKGP